MTEWNAFILTRDRKGKPKAICTACEMEFFTAEDAQHHLIHYHASFFKPD